MTPAPDLTADIGRIKLKNPVIAASGTFGFGREYSEYIDLNELGAIAVKGLTLDPRRGNPPPRIAETPAGILNSIGLQNPGIREFIAKEIPFLRSFDTAIIANIAGNTPEEYGLMAEMLENEAVDAIEVNVSCPNIRHGGAAFGISAESIARVTEEVRRKYGGMLIVKLTPNVTDIKAMAMAAQKAGADAVSLINTILGMAVDIETMRPILANNYGGLSGPAVKPVALRMVHETASAVDVPVIGMGGIQSGSDAVEFILAGASAIMVGTASFIYPNACVEIKRGIANYLIRHGFGSVREITGRLKLNRPDQLEE
ncbi:MAG: dihydroorotate dehydrogenase [Eubacteriales bacterium]|nr:dihydroorotate dehydrogenase [Eubacteriales bacterium]